MVPEIPLGPQDSYAGTRGSTAYSKDPPVRQPTFLRFLKSPTAGLCHCIPARRTLYGIPFGSGFGSGCSSFHPSFWLSKRLKAELFVETVGIPGRKHDTLHMQIV
jgi:hypothetical protein